MSATPQATQPTIALAAIVLSKSNPRKTLDPKKLDELADNIKQIGVLQPILVRPINGGGTFEVVFGHRRYQGAMKAGLTEIPANTRELSDTEALELQVIENQQREDLHPLEEAEGYEALLKCSHDGHAYTVADIAAKVNKSASYVYQKLKLCALGKEARKAFYDGTLDFSKALLIARIDNEGLQTKALKEITGPRYGVAGNDSLSFREAQRHVQQNYMLRLAEAPFKVDDAALVKKAGACNTCPKKTGNHQELFEDVKDKDLCTDPPCFQNKAAAALKLRLEDAMNNGQKVITGKAAKKVMPYAHGEHLEGYVALKQTCYEDAKRRTYGEILGKDFKPTLIESPHAARVIEVASREEVQAGLKKAGVATARPSPSRQTSKQRAQHTQAPKLDAEEIFRERLFQALIDKVPSSPSQADLAMVAMDLEPSAEDHAQINKALGKPGQSLHKDIARMKGPDLVKLIMAVVLQRELYFRHTKLEESLAAAKRWKVNVDAIRKAAHEEVKAKEPKKPTPAAKASITPITPLKRKPAPPKKKPAAKKKASVKKKSKR